MRLSQRRCAVSVVAGLAAATLVWSGPTPPSVASEQRLATRAGAAPSVSPAHPIVGERTTFSGRVPTSAPRPVQLQSHRTGTWRVVGTSRTSATGRYAVTAPAPRSTSKVGYRVVALAVTIHHHRLPATTSATTDVAAVRQTAALTGPTTVTTGDAFTLQAAFTPVRRGRVIEIQRQTVSGWQVVARSAEDGTGRVTWHGSAAATAGTATYRAVAVAAHGAAAATAMHNVEMTPVWRPPTLLSKSTGNLTHVSCSSSTFCVAVDDTGNATTYDGTTWSAPIAIDTRLRLSDVSCPSTSFCTAVDDHGFAMTFDGTHWSAPVAIDPGGRPMAISCPSATFCVSVGFGGGATTYDGTSWSTPTSVAPHLADVSCPTAGHCVAIDFDGHAYSFDGTTWSASTTIATFSVGMAMSAVSCATTTFCVAGDNSGYAYTYDGTTWSASVFVGGQVAAVSCPSTTFCAAASPAGTVTTFDGVAWSFPASRVSPTGLAAIREISCSSSTACVAVGYSSGVAVLSGTTWTTSQPDPTAGGLVGVSCVDPDFCRAADAAGNVFAWDGATWSAPVVVDAHGSPTAISCRSRTWCALVDDSGWAMAYDGTSWASAVHARPTAFRDVSCTTDLDSVDWCLAVGDAGAEAVLGPIGWGAGTNPVDDQDLVGVSCASSNWCVEVDRTGRAVRFDHTTWNGPVQVSTPPLVPELSISCPVVGFCAATSQWGDTWTSDGATWTGAGVLDIGPTPPWGRPQAVSCASASFCVAGLYGGLSTYDGTSWTAPDLSLGTGLTDVSCPTSTFCAVVDAYGDARVYR